MRQKVHEKGEGKKVKPSHLPIHLILSDLKPKGEEVKAKNGNRLIYALRARKATCLFKNSTSSSSNSPLFERKQTRPQPSLRSTRRSTCSLLGFAHLSGRKISHGSTQRAKQQRSKSASDKRGNRFFHRPIHTTLTKKRGVACVFTFFILSIRFILLYLHAELLCAFRIDVQRFALSSPSRHCGTDGFRNQKRSTHPAVSSKRGTPLATK